jgi:putative methyltransferase
LTGDAPALVRCLPGEDATNGFFVSCFIKHEDNVDSFTDRARKRKVEMERYQPIKRKKRRQKP